MGTGPTMGSINVLHGSRTTVKDSDGVIVPCAPLSAAGSPGKQEEDTGQQLFNLLSADAAKITLVLDQENAGANFKSLLDDGWSLPHEIALVSMRLFQQVTISPLDKPTEHLLSSYLQDPKADKTRGIGEVANRHALEGCVVAFLVVHAKTASAMAERISTKRSIYNSLVHAEALLTQDDDASSRGSNGKRRRHIIDCASLSPLLEVGNMNSKEALVMVDVNEVDAALNWFLSGTSSTQEPRVRVVWLMKKGARVFLGNVCGLTPEYRSTSAKHSYKVLQDPVAGKIGSASCVKPLLHFGDNTKIQNLRKHGPIYMAVAAFRDLCYNINFASIVVPWDSPLQKNQVMKGDSLLDCDFEESWTGFETSKCHWHLTSSNSSTQVANIKSQCYLEIDPKLVTQKQDYMGKTFVGCLPSSVNSEYLTPFFTAHLGCKDKAAAVSGTQMQPRGFDFLQLERKEAVVIAKVHMQSNECGRSNNTERQQDGDNTKSDGLHSVRTRKVDFIPSEMIESEQVVDGCRSECKNVPIFVRHCSREVVLTVNLNESSERMVQLFEEKTKIKVVCQYFSYGLKKIKPGHTLHFYGIGRDATVHLCGRLLGGKHPTLEEYLRANKDGLLMEVTLPDGNVSLEMTEEGYRILSTWLSCFTWAFSEGKSWNGQLTLKDFHVVESHVRINSDKKPKGGHALGAMEKDMTEFVVHIRKIFCRKKRNLVSEYPPFLRSFTVYLDRMRMTETISDEDKLFVETHVACTPSWGKLLFKLHLRYKGLTEDETTTWDDAIRKAKCPSDWYQRLSNVVVFKDMFDQAREDHRPYGQSKKGAFILMRDTVMHGSDHREGIPKFQNADKLELMIPVHMEDFLPDIIENLIKSNDVDIRAELFGAKVRCFCQTCSPSL